MYLPTNTIEFILFIVINMQSMRELQSLYQHIVDVLLASNSSYDDDLIILIGDILVRNGIIVYSNYNNIANNASDAKLRIIKTMLSKYGVKSKLATIARIYNTYMIYVCKETLGEVASNVMDKMEIEKNMLECDEKMLDEICDKMWCDEKL